MLTMKQTDPVPIVFRVYDADAGTPVDLTGATITIRARQTGTSSVILPHVPVDLAEGTIQWTPAGELGPGPWRYQITAVRAGGPDLTAPTVLSGEILVEAPIP